MRPTHVVFAAVLASSTLPVYAVSGFAVGSYTANGHSLRLFKVSNTRVDTAYDLVTGNQYSGIAINTHGTHLACWRKTRDGVDSSFTSTDWRKVLTNQDDAALYMMGRYLTPAVAASVTGVSAARAQQLKASLDSAGKTGGSTELWPVDQIRKHQPADWNFDIYYDQPTNTWSKTVHKITQEYRLTLMRIDNPSKTIDLAITGNDLNRYSSPGTLAWPQGDWIYFSTFGNGYRFLYRVNAQTRVLEFVTLIEDQWRMIYNGIPCCMIADDFKMSTLGNRILLNHLGLVFSLDEIRAAKGIINFNGWDYGGMNGLGGCGQTISASGNVGGCQFGPGHNDYSTFTLNWTTHKTGTIVTTTLEAWNRWSLDKNDPQLACRIHNPLSGDTSAKIIESVGVGNATGGQNFAVNSDKWFCLLTGWAPGGRWGSNGQNLILCNFNDSVTLNVSRGPRRPDNSYGTVEPQCFTQPTSYVVDEAHFFVTEPSSDMVSSLVADAAQNYTVPGLDDNTQLSALSIMPLTPYGGLPVSAIVSGPRKRELTGADAVPMRLTGGASGLRIDCGSADMHRIAIFDARGGLVCERLGEGSSEVFTQHDGIRRGIYLVAVRTADGIMTGKVTVP